MQVEIRESNENVWLFNYLRVPRVPGSVAGGPLLKRKPCEISRLSDELRDSKRTLRPRGGTFTGVAV